MKRKRCKFHRRDILFFSTSFCSEFFDCFVWADFRWGGETHTHSRSHTLRSEHRSKPCQSVIKIFSMVITSFSQKKYCFDWNSPIGWVCTTVRATNAFVIIIIIDNLQWQQSQYLKSKSLNECESYYFNLEFPWAFEYLAECSDVWRFCEVRNLETATKSTARSIAFTLHRMLNKKVCIRLLYVRISGWCGEGGWCFFSGF